MPFNKENGKAYGEIGNRTKRAKTQQWENIVGFLVGKGGQRFREILEDLSSRKGITAPEKEFLQHYKDLLEFHQPKLSRTEHAGDKENPIVVQSELTEQQKEQLAKTWTKNHS